MIEELLVRNLGVIREAQLDLGPGLTVVTGETGAGKTLLLGALRMLLGADARADLVGPFADEASVEGRLIRGDDEVGAARRLRRAGRSRTYLDGSIASAAALDEATSGLVEIIGQHDQLSITRSMEVRRLLDGVLDEEGRDTRTRYRESWAHMRSVEADRAAVGGDRPALEREREVALADARTIDAAAFTEGEDDALAGLLGRLRNSESIRELAGDAADRLERASEEVGGVIGALRRIRTMDPGVEEPITTAIGIESEVGDLARSLAGILADLDHDPRELEEAEERQYLLSDLQRRYGPTLAEVLSFARRQEERAAELGSLLERADRIDADLSEARSRLEEIGSELRAARRRSADVLAAVACAHLRELGFARPLVAITVDEAAPGPDGADVATVTFASDDRLEPGPIARVASGGELSRLVLALRLSGDLGSAGTLVFDEVDSGVGGTTAIAVGEKLASLAEDRQVLCVTHLPQVAAFASTHWVVERDGDEARVRRVEGADRIEELTRMLAGLPDSERGREAAEELLARAGNGPIDSGP